MKKKIKLNTLVNPHFADLWNTDRPYVIAEGGRGSFKSSVISLWLVMALKRQTQVHHHANIICIRENQAYLRDSVYEQILWAIDMLHLTSEYRTYKSPLKIEHIKTGSAFYFYGADDPQKLKSNKVSDIIGVWYEEAANVKSAEVFDQANPTFIRNKSPYVDDVKVFYSYNPPKNPYDWINEWIEKKRNDKQYFIDHSTYLDDELGFTTQQTLDLINSYKENDYDYYRYLYLGEAVGLGTIIYNIDLFQEIMSLDDLPNNDRVVQLRFSTDVGHEHSATTMSCYGITYKGNVVVLDTWYYSPDKQSNKMAPPEMANELHEFVLRMRQKYPFKTTKMIVDSANGGLRNEYHSRFGEDLIPVRKLKKVDMIDRVQSLLARKAVFYLPTANNLKYFIPEHRKYQWEEKTLQTDDPKVIKVDDHTVDQFQYLVRESQVELQVGWTR